MNGTGAVTVAALQEFLSDGRSQSSRSKEPILQDGLQVRSLWLPLTLRFAPGVRSEFRPKWRMSEGLGMACSSSELHCAHTWHVSSRHTHAHLQESLGPFEEPKWLASRPRKEAECHQGLSALMWSAVPASRGREPGAFQLPAGCGRHQEEPHVLAAKGGGGEGGGFFPG